MTTTAAVLEKQQLRAAFLALRDSLDVAVRAQADREITARLLGLPAYQAAQNIFCYVSVGSEVDTLSFIEQAGASGKTISVPRCVGNGIMHAHVITDLNELEPGKMNIPAPTKEAPLMLPEHIDLAVIPCLACDEAAYRLGYGGGYYDRYLAGLTTNKTVLCRERFLLAALPKEPHDLPANSVITEERTLQSIRSISS